MIKERTRYTQTDEVQKLIGHEAIVSPAAVRHLDITVETDSEILDGESTMHVSVADVPNSEGVIIMPASWSDYGERAFQKIRVGTMARFSNMRVVGVDFPGMGNHESGRVNEFTEKDYEDLKEGRLTGIAIRSWAALDSAGLLKDDAGSDLPVALWGNSLSTLTVAEMLASLPDGITVSDAYFSEMMALKKQSRLLMAAKFMTKGAKDLDDYYPSLNVGSPEIESAGLKGLIQQVRTQKSAHLKALTVLTKGKQIEVVTEALESGKISTDPEHGTRFHSVNAQNGLTDPMAVAHFSDEIAKFGIKWSGLLRRQELAGEYHGYQDALPALLAQMAYLAIYDTHNL